MLVLTYQRLWGSVLLPYIIQNEPNRSYYKLSECLSPYPNTTTLGTLTSEERELVKIINEYTDRNLFKLFSRDSNVKEFREKVTSDKLEKFIRPYIERRIYKCFTIARDERFLFTFSGQGLKRFIRRICFTSVVKMLYLYSVSIKMRNKPLIISALKPAVKFLI